MVVRKRTTAETSSAKSAGDMAEERVSKEEKAMSIEDKLDYIDQEIRKLHIFCVDSGYSSAQIDKFVQPFSESVKSVKREKWIRRAMQFAVFVAVTAALFYVDPVYRLMCALGRKSAISILPVWDWSEIYGKDCLVVNPFYTGDKLTVEDCEICEGVREIRRVKNISMEEMMESFLKRDVPVIVEDGIRNWDTEKFNTIQAIAQLYEENVDLAETAGCFYSSNLRQQYKDHRQLLQRVLKGEITEYFAHWENCFIESAKALRYLYKRPYFLPPVVEMASNNWVFVSSKYYGKKPKRIDMGQPMMVMAQVKGSTKVIVKAREPCVDICGKMVDVVREGETFVVTDKLWGMAYLPQADSESITIGFAGSFD